MRNHTLSRRKLVKSLALGGAAAALAARGAPAAAAQKLAVTDPKAIAVGYTENAAGVDVKKYPAYVHGSNCENCLQLQGALGDAYRPCALFDGKLVSVGGWCSAWTAEM
jgi:anaerobic selenocysteine-containing dehydrogenase